jgi:hypothetical protein
MVAWRGWRYFHVDKDGAALARFDELREGGEHVPLYLDELWLEWASPADAKRVLERFQDLVGSSGFPSGVTLKAGPWFSNEDAKVIMVLDIADHAATFIPFGLALVHGLIARRRLTPIVEWDALGRLVSML